VISARQRHEKVERTAPGSENKWKVTYQNGKEKWTDDLPGDGKPGEHDERLQEKKQSRPSIQDAKGKIEKAIGEYIKGGDEKGLRQVVEDTVIHLGREVGKETIRGYVKGQKDKAEGKKKEALDILSKSLNSKLGAKMKERIAGIVGKIFKAISDQYDSIKDAVLVTGNAGYDIGRTDIWYAKDEYTRDSFMGYDWLEKNGILPDVKNLRKTHVFIGRIHESNLNKVYRMMQGEEWSPNGEARTMLQRKGIGHTSMYIGDIVISNSKVMMADRSGFVEL
jgi:hypothetical protein